MDAIDERMIGCLLRDGRATYAEIGAVVSLSAPAVKRRVDRLRVGASPASHDAGVD